MPAAYFEDLGGGTRHKQWHACLNIQGVDKFDPSDPLYYNMEHCPELRVKQVKWVSDSSVNLLYDNPQDAATALRILTDPSAGDPALYAPEVSRSARPFSQRPASELIIRQANSGDLKEPGAAKQSRYYRENPDIRGGDEGQYQGRDRRNNRGGGREPRRPQQRDILDYGDEEPRARRRRRYDELAMGGLSCCVDAV